MSAPARQGAPAAVSYIIGTYPSLTTTFIDREITALLDRGVDLRIISIRRSRADLSPSQRELAERVSYLLPPRIGELAWAHVRWMLRRPGVMLRTFAYLLSRRHEHGSRLRTALHFATGVYAAHRLRDRAGTHLHAHFVDRAAIVALVASRLLGSSYSVTAHANDIYLRPSLLPAKFGNATFAVTCTEYNRRHLQSVLGDSIGGKVERAYHGLDLGGYRPSDGSVTGPVNVVSVGQLKEKKGLRYLVEAVAILARRGRELHCEIIGDGPLRAELAEQIAGAGLAERVRLTGALPHPEVRKRYAASHLFVLPCVVGSDGDRDGIPNAILEAMAMQLTVISTPISGIPEVVSEGETGLLVPTADAGALADAIERAMGDPALRARVGAAGRDLVMREFDVGRNVERLIAGFAAGG